MADNTVTERRVRPIQDALAAGNYKQALKECEKWQKKGESSDRFLALKAAVLTQQPDPKQQEKGKNETLQLCQREPAIVNVEALYQLQNTLRHLSLENEEGPKLWERAVITRPTDKDLMVTWLNGSISAGSWQSAQKATMSLRKAFPRERHYEFWNVLMCYLTHRDPKVSEKDRTLFGTLANRLISKIGQSTPSEKGLTNPEELSLWAAILTNTGAAQDVVRLLQSQQMESIVRQDPQHALSLLLGALQRAGSQHDTMAFCDQKLFSENSDQNELEDERIWALQSRMTDDASTQQKLVEKIDKLISQQSDCRAAYLAKLDILAQSSETRDELFRECRSYYDRYCHKAFCFDDLITRLKALGNHQINEFLHEISVTATESSHELFVLKLEYYIVSSEETTPANVYRLAVKALVLHQKLLQSTTARPEAAFLAALALVQLGLKQNDQHHILQACTILQRCSRVYSEYYPLCVLLLQLQKFLALFTLSMTNFYSLSVKNLQWETIGYLLLTRISSLHPWKSDLEPLGFMDAALHVFESADRSLDRSIHDGLKNGSYSNVVDTITVRRNLQYSLCRQLFAIEERKTQHNCGISVSYHLDVQGGDLVDSRDNSYMPTYGMDKSYLHQNIQCGPPPNHNWVHRMARIDHLVTYLTGELGGQATQSSEALTALRKELQYPLDGDDGLTAVEQQKCEVSEKIYNATILQLDGSATQQTEFDTYLEEVQKWLETSYEQADTFTVEDLVLPTWAFLHSCFTILETLQMISLFLGVQTRKTKAGKAKSLVAKSETTSKLQTLVNTAEKATRERSTMLKDGLNAPGVLGKLVDATLARSGGDGTDEYQALNAQLEKLQDEAVAEEFCGTMKDSWIDALDGILAVKVRQYK